MEETRNVNDTEVHVLWAAKFDRKHVVREPLLQIVQIFLSAGR